MHYLWWQGKGGRKRKRQEMRKEEEGEEGRGRGQRLRLTAEEREMNRLERKLGVKKMKKLPTSFREDGLDCILLSHLENNVVDEYL